MDHQTDASISRWQGEFHDHNLERTFFADEIRGMAAYIKPVTIFLGLLYLSFAIPDYFVMTNRQIFLWVLASRLVFLLLCVFLANRLPRVEDQKQFYRLITWAEGFFILLYLLACFLYQPLNLLIQSIGIIVVFCGFFLVPNRLQNLILLSGGLVVLFLAGAIVLTDQARPGELAASAVYLLIIIFLNSLAYLRSNYYRRKQYAISLQLHRLARTDPLTGIDNRQKFNEAFELEVSRARRYRSVFSLILFDIDHFKQINDAFGHPHGDRVLIGIAELVKEDLRATDIFARWGGEEFMLLLPETRLAEATEIAERLRARIEGMESVAACQVTCSFGIVECRQKEPAECLLQRVDDQMYLAKQQGRNQISAG